MVAENTTKAQKTHWPCVHTEAGEFLCAPWGPFGAHYRLPDGDAAKLIQTYTTVSLQCGALFGAVLNLIGSIQQNLPGARRIYAHYDGVGFFLSVFLVLLYLQYTTRKFPVASQRQPFVPTLRRSAKGSNSVALWIAQIVGIAIAAFAGYCLPRMHDFANFTLSLFLFLLGAAVAIACGVLLVVKST